MNNNTVINLQPIINTPTNNLNLNISSFFLYIFAIFELTIIILIFYYFFKIELIFLYNLIFNRYSYTTDDKKTYNKFMLQVKNIIESPKYCKLINNKYYPLYNKDVNMLALNGDIIYFDTEDKCKIFLSASQEHLS